MQLFFNEIFMKVGLFIFFDFTMGGMIFTEAQNYTDIFSRPYVDEVIIYDFHPCTSKIVPFIKVPHRIVKIESYKDAHLFDEVDVLFAWQWHQQMEKAQIDRKQVDVYKIFSAFTNLYKKPVYFRICDTRHFMKDYQQMIEKYRQNPFFVEINGSKIFALDHFSRIDYSLCKFVCNGARHITDWSWMTLTHSMPFLNKEEVQAMTIYYSDDVLFQYSKLYEELSYLGITDKEDALYHVGNINSQKVGRFNEILDGLTPKAVLRLSAKKENDNIKDFGQEIRTPGLYGIPMYEELNNFMAYIFIGNGDADMAYLNKTLYDSSIARTIFLAYKKTDCYGALTEISQYYFDSPQELTTKLEWIKENYEDHLTIQREFLLKNLSKEPLEYNL